MMKPLRPRGQTLAVFALTMLLVTLMVCMTLSIGTKVKEKMELETAADAAAYSQAVATARTYNSISVLNRALMSNMVAMAGVQSLISWSSYYRAVLNEARSAYNTPKAQYAAIAVLTCACPGPTCNPPLCRCSTRAVQDIGNTQNALQREDNRVDTVFRSMDIPAGLEARGLQISSVSDRQNELFRRLLDQNLTGGLDIGTSIAEELNKGNQWGLSDEVTALNATDSVNRREQDAGQCRQAEGAACRRRDAGHKNHFIWATMGTRGHGFVTGRAGGVTPIRTRLMTIIRPPDVFTVTNQGSGYFSDNDSPSHAAKGSTGNKHAWGDDHGNFRVLFLRQQPPCPPGLPGLGSPRAHVRSNDLSGAAGPDQHQWSGGQDPAGRRNQHTMGTCTNCPGMWPPHMDYNWQKVNNTTDVFGQPKTFSILQRDLSKRPAKQADPWNLLFTFKFLKSGSGTEFDNTGLRLVSQGGTDISQATALSAGMAYYHRVGAGYREPPNFLNPFWRATLVRANIDVPGVGHITEALGGAPNQEARSVVEALDAAGYKAW